MVRSLPANAGVASLIPGLGIPLEEETALQSSTLVWKIPWTEEPGGLQYLGLQRVRYDWAHTLGKFQHDLVFYQLWILIYVLLITFCCQGIINENGYASSWEGTYKSIEKQWTLPWKFGKKHGCVITEKKFKWSLNILKGIILMYCLFDVWWYEN